MTTAPITLHVNLLGDLRLIQNGQPLAVPKSRKGLALFLYLACTQRAHPRETLADLLWDATSTSQSLSNLRTVLSRLPAPFAAHLLVSRETIAFDPAKLVAVDAVVLAQTMLALTRPIRAPEAAQLATVLATYHGNFLDGFSVEDAPLFAEWLVAERERLHHLALIGYQQLTAYYFERGEYEAGIQAASALLRHDPTNESGHSHLMRMFAYTGQRSAALAQFDTYQRMLRAEFDMVPADALQRLYAAICNGDITAPTTAHTVVATPPHNLPAQVTLLLGRQAAISAVCALYQQSDTRLVTLTGPGGVGKSRLGEAVAWSLLPDFADGIFLIELAPVHDPHLVLSAIAQPLAVRDQGNIPLQARLHDYLQGQQILLLLDNFEQVIDAAPQVLALLHACPHLKILITSREPLRLHGEQEFPVPILAPQDSFQLFVQRAQAVQPTFTLTEQTAALVTTICQQLDYLPLAIELAAAQSKLFAPQAILARLQDRFTFLISRTRNLPDRQRTLWTALDWSYELLTVAEQQLFRRLAVFRGGQDVATVALVCNPTDDEQVVPLAIDTLGGLAALLDKSLLYQTADDAGEPRFMMLFTIRDFAARQLAASGEAAALQRRHLDYYLALAEQAEVALSGADQIRWLDRLMAELDNLRAALEYAHQSGSSEQGARLSAALRRFWGMRGYVSEGRQWLAAILAHTQTMAPLTKAKALSAAGILAEAQSDYSQAVTLQQAALALYRAHGDEVGVTVALNHLGFLAENQGNYQQARRCYEETLALSRAIQYELYTAISLINLGRLLYVVGEYPSARAYAEEGLTCNRAMGNQWGIALALDTLGHLTLSSGNLAAARDFYEESLAIREGFGGKWGIAMSLRNLGEVDRRRGKYASAQTQYEESLTLFNEINDPAGRATLLNCLASVSADRDDCEGAQQLLQQSLAIYQTIGDRAGSAATRHGLGKIYEAMSDMDTARALYDESLAMHRHLERPLGIAMALHDRARLAGQAGDTPLARAQHQEALQRLCQLGEPYWIEQALRAIAQLFLSDGQLVAAGHLLAAAAALRASMGVVIAPRESIAYEQTLAALRIGLGEDALSIAWTAGCTMTLEQAVNYALSELA